MNVLDANVTALQICQTLLLHLEETADSAAAANDKEHVTGKGGDGSSKMPTLSEVGVYLTQLAADGLLDPMFGRDKEIRACVRTLIRRRKNNVCLIGDAGVGKTAIAEGIAQVLADPAQCPVPLRGHRLVSVELASLVAGTKYRGKFEERLQAIVAEVTNPKSVPTTLFLDEIHNLVGAGGAEGGAEGGLDAANLLKPALARGALSISVQTEMGICSQSSHQKIGEIK
jgi:ATP-dependent Clp protease ATP-binding subunit ClpC